jgi:hypothetical protein
LARPAKLIAKSNTQSFEALFFRDTSGRVECALD